MSYKVGAIVEHDEKGRGKILKSDRHGIIVQFDDGRFLRVPLAQASWELRASKPAPKPEPWIRSKAYERYCEIYEGGGSPSFRNCHWLFQGGLCSPR